MTEREIKTVIECICVYMGDYPAERQYAASILLRIILKEKEYKRLMAAIREEMGFKVNDRSDAAVIRWRRAIRKRGKCEVCGSAENLEAHHIVPWKYSVTGRTDVANGMCLCDRCHKAMHNDLKWIEYMRGKSHGKE